MTEMQARRKYINVMIGWIGLSKSAGTHKVIINTYNNFSPKPSSYKVTYKDAYCATGVSAAAIEAGYTDIIPLECSCGRMIELYKKINRWVENDAFIPQPGDIIFYDWDDDGKGDNTGWSDHVGVVEDVIGNKITVVECNMSGGKVGRRYITVNAKNIRGYGIPDYSKKVTIEPVPEIKPQADTKIKVNSIVNFKGNIHYGNSSASAVPESCKGGKAVVTAVNSNAHPYHLKPTSNSTATVHGWVDAKFVELLEIEVGDIVKFTGNVHYSSSGSTKQIKCKGGLAKVTAISKGKHKYHLIGTEKKCTVYGWVDECYINRQ